MKERIICPQCLKADCTFRSDKSKRVCSVIGAGLGATLGYFGLATFVGITVGGVTGAVAAFHAVSAVGKKIGKELDESVCTKYKCSRCKTIFTK